MKVYREYNKTADNCTNISKSQMIKHSLIKSQDKILNERVLK